MNTLSPEAKRRQIRLEGSHNIRDAGGYMTGTGTLPWARLLRGESLHHLTPTARAAIVDQHALRSVVDLRTELERARHPSPFEGSDKVRYLHRPIFRKFRDMLPSTQIQSYEFMLLERESMRDIFGAIAENIDQTVLIHCTAGKDRTGVVVAMLHELCGVNNADVIRDYLLTGEMLSGEFYDGLRARAASDGVDLHKYEEFLKCVPETIQHTLNLLHEQHGGVENYLLESGVTASEIAAIKHALVGGTA